MLIAVVLPSAAIQAASKDPVPPFRDDVSRVADVDHTPWAGALFEMMGRALLVTEPSVSPATLEILGAPTVQATRPSGAGTGETPVRYGVYVRPPPVLALQLGLKDAAFRTREAVASRRPRLLDATLPRPVLASGLLPRQAVIKAMATVEVKAAPLVHKGREVGRDAVPSTANVACRRAGTRDRRATQTLVASLGLQTIRVALVGFGPLEPQLVERQGQSRVLVDVPTPPVVVSVDADV